MNLGLGYEPEYESIRDLLVSMVEERCAERLPGMIVEGLAHRPHIALANVWLMEQGDECPDCRLRQQCLERASCLHLAASATNPDLPPSTTRVTKDLYRRVPLGLPEAGLCASTGKPVRIDDIRQEPGWRARNPWAEGAGIAGASFYPLLSKGEVLGAIGIYTRIFLHHVKEGVFWSTLIANQAASAIVNARAFQQIEHLKAQLELENTYLREEIDEARTFGDIVGTSPPLRNVLKQVELVAPTDASVLIGGESGTGKELLAREIHRRSRRADRPMIKVNCAAIPGELYESEFFGHVRGAFSGAVSDRAGRFQAADGGTLFLDEIGEIPLPLQSKLLRVLQEGTFERIGEEVTRKVDVRVIAATNRNLKRDVLAGIFRQDLYYRLNVFPIEMVPLRHRKDDIRLLAEHFLRRASAKMRRAKPSLTLANIAELESYRWPGNVRELQNVIERAMITSHAGLLRFDLTDRTETKVLHDGPEYFHEENGQILTETETNTLIRQNICTALRRCRGKIYGRDGAAALLGVRPTTLTSRMKRMNIRFESNAPPETGDG